jgi:hypothetical protein
MLLVPASVFAQEDVPIGPWYLGELVNISIDGGFLPFERIDAWLYSPSTLDGWPLTEQPPVMWEGGADPWWLPISESEQRRWSFSETEGTPLEETNLFGGWDVTLMLPRDEAWYPCSFPFKWNCNYYSTVTGWEFHSPMFIDYIGLPEVWPWVFLYGDVSDPMDTIHPLEITVVSESGRGFTMEAVIIGYEWKASDLP